MEKLGNLVHHRLNEHQVGQAATAAEVVHTTNSLLQDTFHLQSQAAKAYRFERGILYIRAENAVVHQELWGIQHKLLHSLKSRYGEKTVSHITVKWFDNSEAPR